VFPIKNPQTGELHYPPQGSCWRASEETIEKWVEKGRVFFGQNGEGAPQLKRYLSKVQQGIVPTTWWSYEEAGHNDEASKELQKIFESKAPFDTPKPTALIKRVLQISTETQGIVMDFFAGSASTAHAVMQQNAEDGGNRKYIMVQLGEETDEDSEARKAGYSNIAQIARERIQRAGEKIKEEHSEELQQRETPLDIGFKSYKLADSNYRQWDELTEENTQEELLEQAKLFAEKPLVDVYDNESVVYEVLLKEGFGLNSEVKQEKMGELDVWVVNDDTSERRLVVTFAKQLTKDQIESLGLGEDDTFVCFDYALDDETKVNITRNLNVKVI
jgi:adenine-specific DNA-methyltransferase